MVTTSRVIHILTIIVFGTPQIFFRTASGKCPPVRHSRRPAHNVHEKQSAMADKALRSAKPNELRQKALKRSRRPRTGLQVAACDRSEMPAGSPRAYRSE